MTQTSILQSAPPLKDVQCRRTNDHAACENSMLGTIELGFRPDGVVVANELVWIALAPL